MFKIRAITSLSLLLILLALSVGAQQHQRRRRPAASSAAPPATQADYYPLRVGDWWKYRTLPADESQTGTTIKVIGEEKQADGTPLYKVETLAGQTIHSWYSKTGGKVLLQRDLYVTNDNLFMDYKPPRLIIKNPLTVGINWAWSGQDVAQNSASETAEVVGEEMVEVPAGKFKAMKVVARITQGQAAATRTNWYVNGVGLVKSTTVSETVNYGRELVDYSFKKQAAR